MQPIFNISDTLRLRVGLFIFLCLLSGIVLGNLLFHPMNVVGDEPAAIQDARLILENPLNWFSGQRVMAVRPPVDLFFLLGEVFWDARDFGYRCFHIFLHTLTAWLLFCVLRRQKIDIPICVISSSLFLINVSHFRAVQWVMCVNYVLACMFALACFFCLLCYLDTKRKRHLVWSICLIGCAIFSHPASVAVILFCIFYMMQSNVSWRDIGIIIIAGVMFLMMVFLVSPNHIQVQGAINEPDFVRILQNPIWYLGRLFASAHWLPVFTLQNEPHLLEMAMGVFFCLVLGWFVIRRRSSLLTPWAVWSVVMVLPFVNNALDRQIVGPSRQLYLASVGSSIFLAWGGYLFCQKLKGKRLQEWFLGGSFVVVILLSFFSYKKVEAIDYWLVGRSYIASSQIEDGLSLFENAYESGSDILPFNFYTQYAILAFGLGQSVLPQLEYGLYLYPENDNLKVLMGVANFINDDIEQRNKGKSQIFSVLQTTEEKQGVGMDLTAALQNAAGSFQKNQSYDRAIELYELVLEMRPNYVIALVNIGRAYFATKQNKKGVLALLRATELDPNSLVSWAVLGDMVWELGDLKSAILAYQNAHKLNPEDVEFPYSIGLLYEQLEDKENAIFWYQKVLQIDSQHAQALQKLKNLKK